MRHLRLAIVGGALAIVVAAGNAASNELPPPVNAEQAMLSVDSPLGDIFDVPAAMVVLQKYVPEMGSDPASTQRLRTLNLRAVRSYIPSLNPETFALLDAELRRIPAPPPDLSGPAGDPRFVARSLSLAKLPRGKGKVTALFNGRDLDGWDVYLGPPERRGDANLGVGKPVGLNNDPTQTFSVQTVDGRPAIRVDGKIWGALTTKGDYRDYHLHIEYRWGERRWSTNPDFPRNNGILYHSYGEFGALDQTWMNSIELELIPGQIGGVNPVGDISWFKTSAGRDIAIQTPSKRRYMPGGREVSVGPDGFEFIQGSSEAERAIGQWNSIDLYVFGDRAVHVLNGVPVMAVHDLTGGKDHAPLTHGRIQLQSEAAETFFRNITIQQIERLPTVRVGRR